MTPLGVIECFYGLPWSSEDRASYADFLARIGFNFYIYGPKADQTLRQKWQTPFSSAQLHSYRSLRDQFVQKGLRFGMILSPQGLYENWDLASRRRLQDKVQALGDLGLDILGLFFDDMKSSPEMAQKQLEIVNCVETSTHVQVLFCPSYYCFDSLLEIMFGERPHRYLETLGEGLSARTEVLWTGEEIIAKDITLSHLQAVAAILKRKPFICDNFYANDGANCRFLRLTPPVGRDSAAFAAASSWGFNPMSQAHLSKLMLLTIKRHVHQGMKAQTAFETVIRELATERTAEFLLTKYRRLSEDGLESVSDMEKNEWRQIVGGHGPFEHELRQWLDGHFSTGVEVMLKQSCYE